MKRIALSYTQLNEEIDVLEKMISRLAASIAKAADWMISQMAPNGPIANRQSVSYNHKVSWGLYEAGKTDAVIQILDWLVKNARRSPGEYYFSQESPFEKDFQRIYRFLAFGKIAEYLNYEPIANDAERSSVCRYQHESGGCFYCIDDGFPDNLEPLNTSFFGQWALAAGLIDKAKLAADWLVQLVTLNEKYLKQDPPCFYYVRRAADGKLVTEFPPDQEMNFVINTRKVKQPSWATGTTIALLADVYLATGQEQYLSSALKLAQYEKQCHPDQLFWPSKCKSAWGMAELYRITADPQHRQLCADVNRTTLMGAQLDHGGFSGMYYPLSENGVWRKVVYVGPNRNIPDTLPDDGSHGWLGGHEITGEFTGEMGRSRAAFKEVLTSLRRRKDDYEASSQLDR